MLRVITWLLLITWIAALLRTIVNLFTIHRLTPRMPSRTPPVSIIVPARDEEEDIEATVRALLAQTYPDFEVIVIDDRSVDATPQILARIDDPRLTVIRGEEPPAGWLGKPWALHQGSLRARGELLLFVDADVVYAPETVAAAVARIEESDVALVSLFPRLGMRGFWEHIAMPNLAVFAFTFLPLWLANRSRIPYLAVGGGPGNLVRRREYEVAGGHEALSDAVIDDVGLARLMRRRGDRTEVVRADDFVYVRMYHGGREVIEGFTKNGFTTFGRSYLAVFLLTVVTLIGNVLPYALALMGDVVSMITVGVITLGRVILFRSLGYRLDNALLGNVPMVLLWLYILLRSTWVTGIRRQLHWRGRRYDASRTRFGAD